MTSAAKGLRPGAKAALVVGSAILHIAVFGLIWMLLPAGEKSVGASPERTAIPEELVESVRRDVEQRQLAELEIKLTELQNLQNAISGVRESRVERWGRLSTALEEFAPEAAAIIAGSASGAVTTLREILARESGAWEVYRNAAASPEGGLLAREGIRPAASLGSVYEAIRIALAALREQQRLLREKLALGGAGTEGLAQALLELEPRVSAAVGSIDTVQEARGKHERAYKERGDALGRIGGIQRKRDSELDKLNKAKFALEDAQKALAEAENSQKAAKQKLSETDLKDRRAHQDSTRAFTRAKDQALRRQRESKQREDSHKKLETQVAVQEKTLEAAQAALRQSERILSEAFDGLEKTRKPFVAELSSLLSEQEKINQKAAAES